MLFIFFKTSLLDFTLYLLFIYLYITINFIYSTSMHKTKKKLKLYD